MNQFVKFDNIDEVGLYQISSFLDRADLDNSMRPLHIWDVEDAVKEVGRNVALARIYEIAVL